MTIDSKESRASPVSRVRCMISRNAEHHPLVVRLSPDTCGGLGTYLDEEGIIHHIYFFVSRCWVVEEKEEGGGGEDDSHTLPAASADVCSYRSGLTSRTTRYNSI